MKDEEIVTLRIVGGEIRWVCWKIESLETGQVAWEHDPKCIVMLRGERFALCGNPLTDSVVPPP